MRSSPTSGDVLWLWSELGELYAVAGEDAHRAFMQGVAIFCVTAALVLLSAPLFGTSWAGPFAPVIPALTGLLAGGGSFLFQRYRFLSKRNALRQALAKAGEDPECPAARGLDVYYDAQLILLRSEYEFLKRRGTNRALRSARLFEASFGFTPEDGFESGPLNVAADTARMKALRERWNGRIAALRVLGEVPPSLGLREDAHYRVFPREMTVQRELATRGAYLGLSCELLRNRYGRNPCRHTSSISEALRRRAQRDLREYATITGRRAR